MSMKKTDLEKHLAKKLDGRLKASAIPQRFAQGSKAAGVRVDEKTRPTATKLVPLSCRLPAELVHRLRERAVGKDGGVSSLVAEALTHWLESTASKGGA